MRRLGSLISLALSASLVVAFTYWYRRLASQDAGRATHDRCKRKCGANHHAEVRAKDLYYRNPMGVPDTSPVPKKDPWGWTTSPSMRTSRTSRAPSRSASTRSSASA